MTVLWLADNETIGLVSRPVVAHAFVKGQEASLCGQVPNWFRRTSVSTPVDEHCRYCVTCRDIIEMAQEVPA